MAEQFRIAGVRRRFLSLLAIAAAAGIGAPSPAQAQAFPVPGKVIRVIVPYATGGSTDVIGRLVAAEMTKTLGTPVIIENRVGADGLIGANALAQSPKDGYTLGVFSAALALTIPIVKPDLPYIRDVIPVSLIQTNDQILVARNDLGAGSVQEIVAYARANPGKLSFGHTGAGTGNHLLAATMMAGAKVQLNLIPYKGEVPALNDVMGGRLDLAVSSVLGVASFIESGRVRPIASLGTQRARRYPNLPTVSESGFPDFNGNSFLGVHAPAGTPPEALDRIAAAVIAAVKDPTVRERIDAIGGNPVGGDRAAYTDFLNRERTRAARTIKEANVKLDD